MHIYGIFVVYRESERNIVYELVPIYESIDNSNNIICNNFDIFTRSFKKIQPWSDTLDLYNLYTYIGKRIDVNVCKSYLSFNAFVIEPLEINTVTHCNNI